MQQKTKEFIVENVHGPRVVLVDTEDWDKVAAYKWRLHPSPGGSYYVVTTIAHPEGGMAAHVPADGYRRRRRYTLPLHRLIMETPKGMQTDHINSNPLDNRKENLRICTQAENLRHRGTPKNNTSGYKGVDLAPRRKRSKKWRAKICHDKKRIRIGLFATKEEAAMAYDKKALELHGEFATLNFPEKREEYLK